MLIEPFNFDNLRDFGAPEAEQAALEALKAKEALEAEQEEEAPPPPPTYSEEELEQARQASKDRGYEEGIQAGRAQVEGEETERSQHIETLMTKATETCAEMQGTYHGLFQQQCVLLADFVRVTAEKLAGDLLNACPQEAIEEVILQSFPLIIAQPKLQFFVHSELVDPVHKKVLPHLKQRGLEADIDVVADAAMERSDIRIEWKQGHVQRNTAEIMQSIHELLSHVDFGEGLREIQPEKTETAEAAPLELDPPKVEEAPQPVEEDVAAEPLPAAETVTEDTEPEVNMAVETHVDIDEAEDGIEVMHASEGETLLSVGEVDDIVDAPNNQPEEEVEASAQDEDNKTAETPQTPDEPSAEETKE